MTSTGALLSSHLINSIEVAITTYLALHPIQRKNMTYKNEDGLRSGRGTTIVNLISSTMRLKTDHYQSWSIEQILSSITKNRNDQYHNGGAGVPEVHKLEGIREAAIMDL